MALLPQEIIRRKRNGEALTDAEIDAIVASISDGSLGEGQVGAFAMAAFLRGMTAAETVALTRAMTASGRRLDWRGFRLSGPVLDKHGKIVGVVYAIEVATDLGLAIPVDTLRALARTGGFESVPPCGSS